VHKSIKDIAPIIGVAAATAVFYKIIFDAQPTFQLASKAQLAATRPPRQPARSPEKPSKSDNTYIRAGSKLLVMRAAAR
jgi:hypothetical protein